SFAIFLSVVLALLFGVHWYLWLRFVRDTRLEGVARALASGALLAAALSLPATVLVVRALASRRLPFLPWIAYTWLGLMFLFFVLWSGADLARLGAWAVRRLAGRELPSDERRRFLA